MRVCGLPDEDTRTQLQTVKCVSGGFPCQPHSLAGKRLASDDERDLWSELFRIYCETGARWLVAENVRGLLSSEDGRFFRGILRDFADMGFNVGWCTYRAADVGAVHARERVAVVAHSNSGGCRSVDEENENRYKNVNLENVEKQAYGQTYQSLYVAWPVREPKCGDLRNDNGISERLGEIKAYGNAVSPPQFYPIFKAIAELEKT